MHRKYYVPRKPKLTYNLEQREYIAHVKMRTEGVLGILVFMAMNNVFHFYVNKQKMK
jgi:hypothetical protein